MLEIKGKVNTAICYAKVIEDEAINQIRRMCDYDMTAGSKIRIMPDVHAGKGCTIGTTMTIVDKAVPNVVGVDIGCGMYTVNLGKTDIDFEKVMKVVFKGDDYVPSIITFALLERKEKISGCNDTQKKLFNSITEYCFKTMEDMKKDDIVAILKAYTEARKRDESQNKDTNRRYYISSLPESDYPRILKVVSKIIELDEDMKKYF